LEEGKYRGKIRHFDPGLDPGKQSGPRLDCRGASRLAMTVVYDRYRPSKRRSGQLACSPIAAVRYRR
jgi:hypothetical protein